MGTGCPASVRQKETADDWTGVQRARGRGKIRCQLWLSPRDRDFVHDQPLDPVGDHPRDPQLALRHLFRSVPGVAPPRRGTVPCSRGAMEARYGGTADHRGRLSVDDALAPIPAVRARLIKPLEST